MAKSKKQRAIQKRVILNTRGALHYKDFLGAKGVLTVFYVLKNDEILNLKKMIIFSS